MYWNDPTKQIRENSRSGRINLTMVYRPLVLDQDGIPTLVRYREAEIAK